MKTFINCYYFSSIKAEIYYLTKYMDILKNSIDISGVKPCVIELQEAMNNAVKISSSSGPYRVFIDLDRFYDKIHVIQSRLREEFDISLYASPRDKVNIDTSLKRLLEIETTVKGACRRIAKEYAGGHIDP